MPYTLIADIGGTNVRLAAYNTDHLTAMNAISSGSLTTAKTYAWSDSPSVSAAVDAFCTEFELPRTFAAIAVAYAGPADAGQEVFRFTNVDRGFVRADLAAYCPDGPLHIINDFAAQASLIPHLNDDDLEVIKPGTPNPAGARTIFGPGTGLGVAALSAGGEVIAGEGGNVGLPYLADLDLEIVARINGCVALRKSPGAQPRMEDAQSGQGIENIYAALSAEPLEQAYATARNLGAPGISKAALAGDALAQDAMALFFRFGAQLATNLALQLLSTGGVYLAGTIINRNRALLDVPAFTAQFMATVQYDYLLKDVPIYLITADTSGLAGAAAFLAARV